MYIAIMDTINKKLYTIKCSCYLLSVQPGYRLVFVVIIIYTVTCILIGMGNNFESSTMPIKLTLST